MKDLRKTIVEAIKEVGFSESFIRSINRQENDSMGFIINKAIQISPQKAKKALAIMSSKNWHIRWEVAKNPNIPFYVLKKLANDKEWFVRCGIAENPKTPTVILEKLIHDTEWCVRIIARQQLY